jgi:hypothetical protein
MLIVLMMTMPIAYGSGQILPWQTLLPALDSPAMERIRGGRAARVTRCSGRSCQRLHLASIELDYH